jgi:hypothetical protein
MGKKQPRAGPPGKRGKRGNITTIIAIGALAGIVYFVAVFFSSKGSLPQPSARPTHEHGRRASQQQYASVPGTGSKKSSAYRAKTSTADKRGTAGWIDLPQDLPTCLRSQEELMTMPVAWPGFHALCIHEIGERSVSVLLHHKSSPKGLPGDSVVLNTTVHATGPEASLDALTDGLQKELLEFEFQQVDPMVSTSAYDYEPNPWRLYTQQGGLVESDADLRAVGAGGALWLYTGGQFIWPGVRIGHSFEVPIPTADGKQKVVVMTTRSLRPTVFSLHGFLTDEECAFIRNYAQSRMVPSGLAMMDSSGDSRDVRTSTQTFMERNGSPQIRALEERAHTLTRLPYDLGENIQVRWAWR